MPAAKATTHVKPKGEAALRRSLISLWFFLFASPRARMCVAHYPFGMGSALHTYTFGRVWRWSCLCLWGCGGSLIVASMKQQRGAFLLSLVAFLRGWWVVVRRWGLTRPVGFPVVLCWFYRGQHEAGQKLFFPLPCLSCGLLHTWLLVNVSN